MILTLLSIKVKAVRTLYRYARQRSTSLLFLVMIFVVPMFQAVSGYSAEVSVKKLRFVASRPREHTMTRGLILAYTEVFRRLGIEFEFVDVPAKRASNYSNEGKVDGEISRVYDYNDKYSNLVRVDESNHSIRYFAFAIDPNISLDGWDSLARTDYRVDCRSGVYICQDNVSRVVPSDRFTEVNTDHQAIKRLVARRADIFVENERTILNYFDSKEFHTLSQMGPVYRVGIMGETTAHMFLHTKYAEIAPRIAEVIREMKQEGLFQAYHKAAASSGKEVRQWPQN